MALFSIALSSLYSPSALAQWANLWKTPEQRAQDAYQNDDFEYLLNHAPDDNWQAAGEHAAGDFDKAAKSFDNLARQQDQEGRAGQATRSLYNQGVSEAMAGNYQQALESFNQVLERAPEFADAEHNRSIVEQLIEKQQEQQQQQNSENGDQGEQDGEQSGEQDGEQGQDQQSSDEQGDQQSQSSQNDSGQQNDQQSQDTESQPENSSSDQSDAENAQDALAAEAASEDPGSDSQSDTPANAEQSELPMSESEQATEQWLRRIPDDPAGLLRRKLEQSHRSEFPEVRDAAEPW